MFWQELWASIVFVTVFFSPLILMMAVEIVWEAIEKRKTK